MPNSMQVRFYLITLTVYLQGVEMMEFSARRFQDLELTDHENALMAAVCAMYPGKGWFTLAILSECD